MELEKKSYSLFNYFFEMYYKLLKLKSFNLSRNSFSILNADLFIYAFLFYNLFFKRHLIKDSLLLKLQIKDLSCKLTLHAKTLVLLYNQILLNKLNRIGTKPNRDNLASNKYSKQSEEAANILKSKNKLLKKKIKKFYQKSFYKIRKALTNVIDSNGFFYIKKKKI